MKHEQPWPGLAHQHGLLRGIGFSAGPWRGVMKNFFNEGFGRRHARIVSVRIHFHARHGLVRMVGMLRVINWNAGMLILVVSACLAGERHIACHYED